MHEFWAVLWAALVILGVLVVDSYVGASKWLSSVASSTGI